MNDVYANTSIFTVTSTVDLAMTDIYLSDIAHAHILAGHRDLRSMMVLGVQATVEKSTAVYMSSKVPNRFLFKSDEVKSKGGNPMVVVVERHAEKGKIITASPRPNTKGQLIWESSGSIYSNYDDNADLLYISKGTARDADVIDSDEDDRIWYRAAEEDNSPVGVTIFDLRGHWRERVQELAGMVSRFLNVPSAEKDGRIRIALA